MAAFLDTNILVYAFAESSTAEVDKVRIARALVENLSRTRELILSAQVLSEFISAALRKGQPGLGLAQISERVLQLSTENVLPIDSSLVQRALQRVEQSRISYWDALIVEAAIRSGAGVLYTEDMQHGAQYGGVELRNPFLR
jgi:predicted nucleic acid-binding protein